MRIGWLADRSTVLGGAELTQAEFKAGAPDGVEIVDCPPGQVDPDLDRYAIHNCITYSLADLEAIGRAPAFRYWNDVGSWYDESMMRWLFANARPICCSSLQADYMQLPKADLIPPPVNLRRFEEAAATTDSRRGAVCVASWRNLGKGPQRVVEWAAGNGGVDFFGPGPFAPAGSREVAYQGMPGLLARYRTFVFLPLVIEPFGRVVAEAWAAGCELVVNGLVGATYWVSENPDGIRTAAKHYWELLLNA